MMLAKNKTPTWLLERVAQGELDKAEVEQVRAELAAEGRSLEAELSTLRESNREILAEMPREMMAKAIERRATDAASGAPVRTPLRKLVAPLALAGTMALAIVMVRAGHGGHGTVPGVHPPIGPSAEEEIGIKGDSLPSPRLLVYRQRAGQAPGLGTAERLWDGARGARGDLLQLAYDKAPDSLYGVLLSIDGAGRVTQHLPEEGASASAPLTSVREIRLPSAYELDDAPSFERFVLITAPQPFAIGAVLDAAHALANRGAPARTLPLALGPAFHQTSVLLNKSSEGSP